MLHRPDGNRSAPALRATAAHLGIATLLATVLLPAGLAAARADRPGRPSTVESLVAAAHAAAATDADRAALLAAEAYRIRPSARTHAALLTVLDATAPLTSQVVLPDEVTAMSSVSHTDEVLAATTGGDVVRWDLTGEPEPVASVDGWITDLVSSTAASTVAALDSDGAVHLLRDGEAHVVATSALDTAVSPTGRHLAVLIDDDAGRRLDVLAVAGGATVAKLDLDGSGYDSVDLTDEHLLLSTQNGRQDEHGSWERRALPGLERKGTGSALPDSAYDAHLASVPVVSQYGARIATVHPLMTTVVSTADGARTTVRTDGLPTTLDLGHVVFSPDGGKYLVVRGQTSYVLDVVTEAGGYWMLQGALAADTAAFADENRVVTAQGRVLTLWNLAATMPNTEVLRTELAALEQQALSPDGRFLVAAGDEPGEDGINLGVTHDLDATPAVPQDDQAVPAIPTRIRAFAERHGPEDTWLPVVTDDGAALFVETADGSLREGVTPTTTTELSAAFAELTGPEVADAYSPPIRAETGLRDVLRARISSTGELVLAAADGSVRVLDPDDGHPIRETSVAGGPWRTAAIAPDGRHVAFSTGATVAVVDTTTGAAAVQLLRFDDVTAEPVLAFGADEIVAAHQNGVTVLERDGSAIRAATQVPVPAGLRSVAVLPGTGLAALAGDHAPVILVDLATGEHVGGLSTATSRPTLSALPDRLLAIGSDADNHQVVRRDTSADSLLETACAVAGRDLSAEEWSQVVAAPPPPDLTCERAR